MEIYLGTVSNSGLFTLNFRALLHMISTVEFNWKSVYSNKAFLSVCFKNREDIIYTL